VQVCFKIPGFSQIYPFWVRSPLYSSRLPHDLSHILPNGSEKIGLERPSSSQGPQPNELLIVNLRFESLPALS